MECETIENLDELHMCREECVDVQIGFCMKIGKDHKEALWRQCDFKDELAWQRNDLKKRQCEAKAVKKADMAEYKCLNEMMNGGVAQENAFAECEARWWAVRDAEGGDLCPLAM